MGFLTTFTIYNDKANNLANHPREITDKLLKACSGIFAKSGVRKFTIGMEQDSVIVQTPRYHDDKTIYVHFENEVFEISSNSWMTNDLKYNHPELFQRIVDFLETEVSLHKGEKIPEPFIPVLVEEEKEVIVAEQEPISDEKIVKKWLKDNTIPMTISELKKYKKIIK